MTSLAPTLQSFFTQRLATQRAASPNTIASYRDTFCLLIDYTTTRTGKPASKLDLADLNAELIAGFLHHLEADRANSPRTRNTRLAAIRSLSITPRLSIPSTPRTSNASSRSLRNASIEPSSRSSPNPKPKRYLPPRTVTHGPGDATTPCSNSLPRPGYESRKSQRSPSPISNSEPQAHTSLSLTAKDVSNARRRSPPAPSPRCGSGSENKPDNPPTHCSQADEAPPSAATLLRTSSPNTPQAPSHARR